MSLETPEKLRTLQEALGAKAKREPSYRFYVLYDKVYRDDVLLHAWALSRSKKGAPGVDGKTFADIEAYGVEKWLAELQEELRKELYKPQPVRRVMIPKASGVGERPLGYSDHPRSGGADGSQARAGNRSSKSTSTTRHTAIGRIAARSMR